MCVYSGGRIVTMCKNQQKHVIVDIYDLTRGALMEMIHSAVRRIYCPVVTCGYLHAKMTMPLIVHINKRFQN